MKSIICRLTVVGLLGVAGQAMAAEPRALEASISVVSDYRFRGISLSDENPALQVDLTASHGSGLYANLFASTIQEYGIGADGDGAKVELDYMVGWAGSRGGLDFDLAASLYTYPDGSGVSYVELPLQVSRTQGAWTAALGLAYAPAQDALGDQDNRYGWGELAFAGDALPVALALRVGHEDGAFADAKTDWSLTASRDWGRVNVGLGYVDSDQSSGALVLSISVSL